MSGAVPKLRFPEFVGEWSVRSFGDLTTIASGQVDPTVEPYASMPHIAPDNIESRTGNIRNVRTAREDGVFSGKYAFDNRAIVYSKIRPNLNKVAKPDIAGVCSADMYPIWGIEGDLDTGYLLQVMRGEGFVSAATAVSMRTGLPKINRPDLNAIPMPVPASLPEQQKIADFLGTVDAKLDALRRKKSGLEAFKTGLMQRLFSQELRFTRDDGSEFPEWEERALGQIFTVCYGKDHKALDDGAIPVYWTGGIMRYVDRELWHGPSILIGRKGTIDRPMLVDGPFWTVDTLFYTRLNEGFNPRLVFALVEQVEWSALNEATGVPSLTSKAISSVRTFLPTDPIEQRKIADALSAMDAKIASVANQITHMETFKKGLLQQMFV